VSSVFDSLSDEERRLLRLAPQPKRLEPMKATLTDDRFSDPNWMFERKLDGIRCVAFRTPERVRLLSRTAKELNRSYPELVEALERESREDFVADGEIVAFRRGVTSFERLQHRMQIADPDRARRTGVPVFLYLFDIVHLEGRDTRALSLRTRKALLRKALRFYGPIRYMQHRNTEGEALYREACRRGLEGLIAKRVDSPYTSRRSRDWLKFKCSYEQELVIGGFTDPQGTRTEFGALLVGFYEDGDLRYAGKVGTGFDRRTLKQLGKRLRGLERDDAPFVDFHPIPPRTHWVEPRLVGQFAFTEWTRDGRLRHPRYLGLRDDKRPREVVRERPA
jgi:bifunctional non-homologous end joining protein LigD